MTSLYKNLLDIALLESLNNDLEIFLKDLTNKYGNNKFTFDELKQKYQFINIKPIDSIKCKNNYSKKHIDINDRCQARIWGETGCSRPIVKYDKKNNKWIYGQLCKRKAFIGNLCKSHSKKLPHGLFTEEPPHRHFDKFKKQLFF